MATGTVVAVKPYLRVEVPKAQEAAEFYKAAFGAVEVGRSSHLQHYDYGMHLHAEVQLKMGSTTFTVGDVIMDPNDTPKDKEAPDLVTEDVRGLIEKAVSAGAVKEWGVVEDGSKSYGKIKDPYGYTWIVTSPQAS